MTRNERIQGIWYTMKQRCCNPKSKDYKYYGGKGITICDEWMLSSKPFLMWSINNGYDDTLTIDRIDNSKGYSPDNCRWITMREQAHNKSNAHIITINGETKSVIDWCRDYGIKKPTFYGRLHRENTGESLIRKAREYGRSEKKVPK